MTGEAGMIEEPMDFVSDSHTRERVLLPPRRTCAFEAPFRGLGATYDVLLRLIGKLVGDFLLVIIEVFSLGAFVLSQFTRLTDRQTDR